MKSYKSSASLQTSTSTQNANLEQLIHNNLTSGKKSQATTTASKISEFSRQKHLIKSSEENNLNVTNRSKSKSNSRSPKVPQLNLSKL